MNYYDSTFYNPTVTIESAGLTFICSDPIEAWRARTILEKEPGTVAWIETFQPGEVFWDVGANIGVYSLLAAKRGCVVVAFEPHPGSAAGLRGNIAASGLDVRVEEVALSSVSAVQKFYVRSGRSGSSGSQIGEPRDESGHAFQHEGSYQILTARLDDNMIGPVWQRPDHIKIDVDGQELNILYGARDTLGRGVTSVQVETHPAQKAALLHYMQAMGYRVDRVHYTQNGQKAIDKGADPVTVVCNTIFVREDA